MIRYTPEAYARDAMGLSLFTRPAQRVLSAALGGAAATHLADGDRPAQALSLEETMRRAPARDNADGHETREPYRGHDVWPARRVGY